MSAREGFFSFGFRVFLYIVIGLVLSDSILYYVTDSSISNSYYEALVILTAAKQTTFALSVTLNVIIHLTIVAAILIASLVLSNKIAGPMYRFERVAESVKDGDLGVKIAVRRTDFMRSQAEDFRLAVSMMSKKIDEVRAASDVMAARASELEAAVSGEDAGETLKAELLTGMKSDLRSIRDSLSFFKT